MCEGPMVTLSGGSALSGSGGLHTSAFLCPCQVTLCLHASVWSSEVTLAQEVLRDGCLCLPTPSSDTGTSAPSRRSQAAGERDYCFPPRGALGVTHLAHPARWGLARRPRGHPPLPQKARGAMPLLIGPRPRCISRSLFSCKWILQAPSTVPNPAYL